MPLALVPAPPPARRCRYRQRDAFLSPLWRILVDHLETFVATYDSRFVDAYGPLKPYAEKAFGSLLLCGDPNLGVTRFSCCTCNIELAVPFSCKTRICPSCAKRRAEEVQCSDIASGPAIGRSRILSESCRALGCWAGSRFFALAQRGLRWCSLAGFRALLALGLRGNLSLLTPNYLNTNGDQISLVTTEILPRCASRAPTSWYPRCQPSCFPKAHSVQLSILY